MSINKSALAMPELNNCVTGPIEIGPKLTYL